MRDIKADFAARGALGHGRLPVVLDQCAAGEYERRAKSYLEIAKRVVDDTGTPWNQSAASSVELLLTSELADDWQELLDRLRATVGPQHQTRIDVLELAKNRMSQLIQDELAVAVLKQDRTKLPLAELLSPPRYAAVLSSWQKASAFLNDNPPDFANAAKEAVGAVEALARIVVSEPKVTLGDCIKRLRSSGRVIGPALKGLEEVWATASYLPGVRHGGSSTDLDAATARYIVEVSQAALRFLLATDAA